MVINGLKKSFKEFYNQKIWLNRKLKVSLYKTIKQMVLLIFILGVPLTVLLIIYLFDKISTYYFVKSLSLDNLKHALEKYNEIIEELSHKGNANANYIEKIFDKRDMYLYLIKLKQKQLGITIDEIHG